MTKEASTIESILREKIATGFDPFTISVSPKEISEENIVVAIEGKKYSVKGDELSLLTPRLTLAKDADSGTGESAPVDNPEPAELNGQQGTADLIPDEVFAKRTAAILNHFGEGAQLHPVGVTPGGETKFEVTRPDEDGDQSSVLADGTLEDIEQFVAGNRE